MKVGKGWCISLCLDIILIITRVSPVSVIFNYKGKGAMAHMLLQCQAVATSPSLSEDRG